MGKAFRHESPTASSECLGFLGMGQQIDDRGRDPGIIFREATVEPVDDADSRCARRGRHQRATDGQRLEVLDADTASET